MTSPYNDQTLYDVLEVSPNATREEILRAYQRAKSAYSTNSPALYSIFSKEEAEQLLKLIDEAYSVLINQEKRREYDQQLATKRGVAKAKKPVTEIGQEDTGTAIPDFAIPEANAIPFPTNTREADAAHAATNANRNEATKSRGKFSHYDPSPSMEKEISEQQTFDGEFLAKIRNYKRVSLDQISDFTRIGRHYLIAVEANDFNSLPAPVFVRGFISNIARILGLEEKKVVESYMKLYKEAREPKI